MKTNAGGFLNWTNSKVVYRTLVRSAQSQDQSPRDRSYHRHETARTHRSCAIVLRRVTQCRSLTLHNVHCSSGYTQECLETFRKQEITGRRPKLEEELGRTQRRVKLRRLSSCKGARASSRSEHCCD